MCIKALTVLWESSHWSNCQQLQQRTWWRQQVQKTCQNSCPQNALLCVDFKLNGSTSNNIPFVIRFPRAERTLICKPGLGDTINFNNGDRPPEFRKSSFMDASRLMWNIISHLVPTARIVPTHFEFASIHLSCVIVALRQLCRHYHGLPACSQLQ